MNKFTAFHMTSESDGLYYFLIMDKSNKRYYSAKVMITRR